jgi:DNA (cytosine-5)-methyltransferase 1
MKRDSFTLPLAFRDELIIDNFAGGGGASTGIEQAFGRPVDIAINHNAEALAMHRANHPRTAHFCESVWDVDPRKVTGNQPVALVWLSPDCKHFSKAKGGKPVEKKIRGLAWVALRWAAVTRPRVIVLENVEEFVSWGPLTVEGRPCPKQKGREFRCFVNALRRQGYTVDWREMRACDFGAPTIRKRFFLIARRDGLPICWPAPTYGHPASKEVTTGKLKPWRTAAECINWSIPAPSIFERSKPLADATCRRIAKGIMRYVVNAAEPYIVKYYGEKAATEFRGHAIDEPLHTQSTENRFALVAPVLTEHANASSPRCMPADEPLRTVCAQTKGGHHALVTAFLAKHYGGVVGTDMGNPISTITSVDHHSLVTSNMIKLRGDNIGAGTDEPLHTISAGGTHHAEVRAFLIKYYGTDQDPNLRAPLHTVTTKDRFGLVTVAGEEYAIADIGLRMLTPRELFNAQGFPSNYIIDHGVDEHGQRISLTKTAQVRMCGNSVCPPLAKAIVKANFAHESTWRQPMEMQA